MVTLLNNQRLKTMIKTKKKVIHLIHGLLALSAVDNPNDLEPVQNALTRAKKGLTDHEILISIGIIPNFPEFNFKFESYANAF